MDMDQIRALEDGYSAPWLDIARDCYGWSPYSLAEVSPLLDAAIGAAPGTRFLEAGCGIGGKCLLAASRGLDAYGIDVVPEYVNRATELGVNAGVADVREFSGYAGFDIVYLSHPLTYPAEAKFETWLHGQMAPGAVLMSPRVGVVPDGWAVVVQEQYMRAASEPPRLRGVYVKPAPGYR